MTGTVVSPMTEEALRILADSVRVARLRRGWTVAELARRVGVSRPTLLKVERGDPTVAIGTVFEAARLVGVPLFDAAEDVRGRYGVQKRAELALLPSTARPRDAVDDDF